MDGSGPSRNEGENVDDLSCGGIAASPESDQGSVAAIANPGRLDVLLGRGRGNQQHDGNKRLQGKSCQFKVEPMEKM